MKTSASALAFETQSLIAFRITSIRERGFPTRTVAHPIAIALPAQLEGMRNDAHCPDMVQVKYRGEWYLTSREALNARSLLHWSATDPSGLAKTADDRQTGKVERTLVRRSCDEARRYIDRAMGTKS